MLVLGILLIVGLTIVLLLRFCAVRGQPKRGNMTASATLGETSSENGLDDFGAATARPATSASAPVPRNYSPPQPVVPSSAPAAAAAAVAAAPVAAMEIRLDVGSSAPQKEEQVRASSKDSAANETPLQQQPPLPPPQQLRPAAAPQAAKEPLGSAKAKAPQTETQSANKQQQPLAAVAAAAAGQQSRVGAARVRPAPVSTNSTLQLQQGAPAEAAVATAGRGPATAGRGPAGRGPAGRAASPPLIPVHVDIIQKEVGSPKMVHFSNPTFNEGEGGSVEAAAAAVAAEAGAGDGAVVAAVPAARGRLVVETNQRFAPLETARPGYSPAVGAGNSTSTSSRGPLLASPRPPPGLSLQLPLPNPDGDPTETERKSIKVAKFAELCSEMLPFLFVGGERVARDGPLLRSHGITHVLNCAGDAFPNFHEAKGIEYTRFFFYDSKQEMVGCAFFTIVELVERVRAAGGRLFVHCHQVRPSPRGSGSASRSSVSLGVSFLFSFAVAIRSLVRSLTHRFLRRLSLPCSLLLAPCSSRPLGPPGSVTGMLYDNLLPDLVSRLGLQ